MTPILPDLLAARGESDSPDLRSYGRRRGRKPSARQAALLEQGLARVMCAGAELRIATDIGDYARWILSAMREQHNFHWTAQCPRDWRERGIDWPSTRYEQKALSEGRRCRYFRFRRV